MMGWKLIDRPKTYRVTKALATEFAEMESAPHDRPLSERRLTVYSRLLKEGSFRPVTWAKAICEETNGIYRVNGKHTSVMLSGMEEMPEFYVTIESYECETLDDVARLYATFDSSIQSRSARDIYLSFAATVTELKDLSVKIINVVPPAIHYVETAFDISGNRAQPAERAEWLLEHPEFCVWLEGLVDSGLAYSGVNTRSKQKCGHLLRVGVVAAMYSSFKKSVKAATEFWTMVAQESDPSAQSPSRKLARFLLTSCVSTGGVQYAKRVVVSQREMYVKCIHAWNAWRKGDTTNLNYYADKDVPAAK